MRTIGSAAKGVETLQEPNDKGNINTVGALIY